MAKAGPILCSFCNRDKKDVKILIAGITGHICDNCISQAYKMISEEGNADSKQKVQQALNLLKPNAIKTYLDEYVIGQSEAKKY
jgi:ATP-dependent Clp protease ATP-binding subunit ClpX